MSIKAYKYRIEVNKATQATLQWVLDRARELYNAALAERKEAYRMVGKSITYYAQKRDLVEIKEQIRPEYQEIASHVLQDVILRVKKAYDNFFRQVKYGERPGHPRFQGRNRYDSFTYPDGAGWKLEVGKAPDEKRGRGKGLLYLSKIGTAKVILHRQIEGRIKTVTIKREGTDWYAVFTCEVATKPLPIAYEDVGVDLGVTHFAAFSTGEFIDHPRYFRQAEKKLVAAQQAVARKKRDSPRRAKAVKHLAKQHRKVRNQRKDFHHKTSRQLVNRFQVIAFEDVRIKNLTKAPAPRQDAVTGVYLPNGASSKAGLNTAILDAGWGTFTEMVSTKAAWAGRQVIFVNPKHTSQACSGCGTIVKKDLSERWHSCACGTELDRDTNAAVNILALGRKQLLVGTRPTSATA